MIMHKIYFKNYYSMRYTILKQVFNKVWFSTATILTVSNTKIGFKECLKQDSKNVSDKMDPIDKTICFSMVLAMSAAKGAIIGCPIIFLPNMTARVSKYLYHNDVNYLLPPFYFGAQYNTKLHPYVVLNYPINKYI